MNIIFFFLRKSTYHILALWIVENKGKFPYQLLLEFSSFCHIIWQIMSYHKKWSSDIDFWSTPKNNGNFLCCFCARPWKQNSLKNKLLGGIQCLVLDFDFIFYDICKKHYHPLMIPIHFSFKITFFIRHKIH